MCTVLSIGSLFDLQSDSVMCTPDRIEDFIHQFDIPIIDHIAIISEEVMYVLERPTDMVEM